GDAELARTHEERRDPVPLDDPHVALDAPLDLAEPYPPRRRGFCILRHERAFELEPGTRGTRPSAPPGSRSPLQAVSPAAARAASLSMCLRRLSGRMSVHTWSM